MVFKICINEPKAKKSWQIEKDVPSLIGLKIGDKFDGSTLGLSGFSLQITGGSDKDGFPMRKDVHGGVRPRILIGKGIGFKSAKKGERRRKLVRGNTITEDIVQVNLRVPKVK
jgi:small subunit ribosomal protein S6e